jgi:hypothetical protein
LVDRGVNVSLTCSSCSCSRLSCLRYAASWNSVVVIGVSMGFVATKETDRARRRTGEGVGSGVVASLTVSFSFSCSLRICFRRVARSKSLLVRGVSSGLDPRIERERDLPLRGLGVREPELGSAFGSSMLLTLIGSVRGSGR